jgi:hypothetical protein
VQTLAVVVLALSLVLALAAPPAAIADRLELARLLVWFAPPFVVWIVYSAYDIRLLSAAWPPLLLVLTRALLPAFAGALTFDARAVAVPAAATVVLAAYGSVDLNGFGNGGWHQFTSALGSDTALRSVALGGDFDAELTAVQPQVRPDAAVVTTDARLQFYYPSNVRLQPPTDCSQLRSAPSTVFVLLESDEERTLYGPKAAAAYWAACRHPTPTMVAERPGAFAIFVTGHPVNESGGCATQAPTPGLAVEFGRFRTDAPAERLLAQAKRVGFVQAKVERLGCNLYRVVETGIPNAAVGRSIVAEAKTAKLDARLVESP